MMQEPRPNGVSPFGVSQNSRTSRTVVLCFDGTNGQYEAMNTNVVKLFDLLRKDCPEQQVAYYQPGIGTYFASDVVSPLWTWLVSLLDKAIAWYLDEHVMGGYRFLMDNYRTGDKICLFGFSRGAYTARALAGMLDKVGLLLKGNLQQVNFAYKAYARTDRKGIELAAGFKQTFSQEVNVDFLGVWDTVQSTGVLVSRELPFTDNNTCIKVFRHALSLDEHRARFHPKLYHWPTRDEDDTTNLENSVTRRYDTVKSTLVRLLRRHHPSNQPNRRKGLTVGDERSKLNSDTSLNSFTDGKEKFHAQETFSTDVLEVWFSGCHRDVGGGNVENSVNVSLAQITLHWMVEQIIQSKCGILFDDAKLAHIGFPVSYKSARAATNNRRPVNEVALVTGGTARTPYGVAATQSPPSSWRGTEHQDATAPLFDELKINPLWWILEFFPISIAWQDDKRVWHSKWSINMGRGRIIPFEKPKFHHTVKERMECESLKYRPRAVYDHNVVYV